MLFRNVCILDADISPGLSRDVLVSGNRIAAILPPGQGQDTDVVDGGGHLALLPGLVNAHTHAAMTLLRGLGEERNLMEWLQRSIWPLEARLRGEHVYWGSLLAITEMLSQGITCFGDMYFFMDDVARGALESGIRCGLSRGIVWGENAEENERRLQEQEELFRSWHGREGRINVQFGPHAPYTVPLEQLRHIAQLARERGTGVHIHWLETAWELDHITNTLKKDPVRLLEEAGLWDVPRLLLAHGVHFPVDRLAELARPSLTVVHNPGSNLKLGSGVAPVPALLAQGVQLALGSDGAASNNRLDIWGEMRLSALLHKGVSGDPTTVTAAQVLRMATVEGARALGFDDVGLLREGWQADLMLVDLDLPHYVGWTPENLLMYLVYAGSSADVVGTMVQGRWLYRRKEFATLDALRIRRESSRCRQELLNGREH